jgi:hypothetical protein
MTPQVSGGVQPGRPQGGSVQVGGAQVGGARVRGPQDRPAQVGGAQDGSVQVGGAQVGGARVRGPQDRPAQVGGAQDGSVQVGGAQATGDRREAALRRAVRALTYGPRRPQLPAVAWRWRYEVGVAIAIPTVVISLHAILGWRWTLADIVVFAMFLCVSPSARHAIIGRARCVITAHRIRTGCAEAYLVSRRGALPLIYSTAPAPYGERVRLWCPAGILAEDFELAADILAAACWAREIRVARDPEHTHLVTLDVIRQPGYAKPAAEDLSG